MKKRKLSVALLAVAMTISSVQPVCAAEPANENEVVQAEGEALQVNEGEEAVAETEAPAEADAGSYQVQNEEEVFDEIVMAKTVDEVAEEIATLEPDATKYTGSEEERAKVEAVYADYLGLSAEDQATLDNKVDANVDGQPLGRVLEAAYWTVHSYDTVDNSTTLPDGIYDVNSTPALSSVYSKGKSTSSRNVPWDVQQVEVKDGKAFATIHVKSKNYSGIMFNGQTYSKTGGTGNNSLFENVPIDLNSTFYFNGVSSMPRPIAFSMSTTIEESAAEEEATRVDLDITNNTGMFKVVSAYLETKDDKTELVFALSGTGYHELYKGTYEQAVANDTNTDAWTHGAENADGKWEFRMPVTEGESYIPVVAISNSYYNKFLQGTNALARAFYPRQIVLDQENKTLVSGDYENSKELNVTNNIKMFKVTKAELATVGGPNSNGYKSTLALTVGSDAYDKAYIGSGTEVDDETAVVALGEGNVFEFQVKVVEEFGNPKSLKNLMETPFTVSFHSAKKNCWYDRQFTVNEDDGTIVMDDLKADYTAVDDALANVPEDLSEFTEESAERVTAAVNAVKRDLNATEQAAVDAMAEAIVNAVEELENDGEDELTGQWKKSGNRWWYELSDGTYLQNELCEIDGQFYYFDEAGWMATGWKKVGYPGADYKEWHYFDADGKAHTGWLKLGTVWYYFAYDGYMFNNYGFEIDDVFYFFNSDGALVTTPGWQSVPNEYGTRTEWFYVKADGTLQTGWAKIGGKWYYFYEYSGRMAQKTTYPINGVEYCFGEDGSLYTGWLEDKGASRDEANKAWLYFDSNGLAKGWKNINNTWYFFAPDTGIMFINSTEEIDGVIYKFNSSGAMVTGWDKVDDIWYYYTANGMAHGWLKLGTVWYYFDPVSGAMYDNCAEMIGNHLYGFRQSGAMATGWFILNDEWYYFETSGAGRTGWVQSGSNWYWIENGVMNTEEYAKTDNGKWSKFSIDENGNGNGIWLGYAPDYQEPEIVQ